jgi:hypothetical protein
MADGKRCCDECGCPIEFIEGPNGKHIPVQKVTLVYFRRADGKLGRADVTDRLDANLGYNEFYVSHYQTCSNPGRFSRHG